jgi:hypothetical protein
MRSDLIHQLYDIVQLIVIIKINYLPLTLVIV